MRCVCFGFSIQENVRASWSRCDSEVVVLEIEKQRTSKCFVFLGGSCCDGNSFHSFIDPDRRAKRACNYNCRARAVFLWVSSFFFHRLVTRYGSTFEKISRNKWSEVVNIRPPMKLVHLQSVHSFLGWTGLHPSLACQNLLNTVFPHSSDMQSWTAYCFEDLSQMKIFLVLFS